MNLLPELFVGFPLGSDSASRAWDQTALHKAADRLRASGWIDGDQLSATGRSFRESLQDQTNKAQRAIIAAIGDRLDDLVTACTSWSQMCIDAKAFPPNVFERAAG